MHKPERVGIIIETANDVLLVKERRDHYLQNDLKALNSFFTLPTLFSDTIFYRHCYALTEQLKELISLQDSRPQALALLSIVFATFHKLKNYQQTFEFLNSLQLDPPSIKQLQAGIKDHSQSDILKYLENNPPEKCLQYKEEIDRLMRRINSIFFQGNQNQRKLSEIIDLIKLEKNKAHVRELIKDGKFSLPGGKWEKGETLPDTAVREIQEETQLRLEKLEFFDSIYGDQRTHRLFVAKVSGELELETSELSGIGFLDINSSLPVDEFQLNKMDIPYLRSITQGHLRRLYRDYIQSPRRKKFRAERWRSDIKIPDKLLSKWYADRNLASRLDDFFDYKHLQTETDEKARKLFLSREVSKDEDKPLKKPEFMVPGNSARFPQHLRMDLLQGRLKNFKLQGRLKNFKPV